MSPQTIVRLEHVSDGTYTVHKSSIFALISLLHASRCLACTMDVLVNVPFGASLMKQMWEKT